MTTTQQVSGSQPAVPLRPTGDSRSTGVYDSPSVLMRLPRLATHDAGAAGEERVSAEERAGRRMPSREHVSGQGVREGAEGSVAGPSARARRKPDASSGGGSSAKITRVLLVGLAGLFVVLAYFSIRNTNNRNRTVSNESTPWTIQDPVTVRAGSGESGSAGNALKTGSANKASDAMIDGAQSPGTELIDQGHALIQQAPDRPRINVRLNTPEFINEPASDNPRDQKQAPLRAGDYPEGGITGTAPDGDSVSPPDEALYFSGKDRRSDDKLKRKSARANQDTNRTKGRGILNNNRSQEIPVPHVNDRSAHGNLPPPTSPRYTTPVTNRGIPQPQYQVMPSYPTTTPSTWYYGDGSVARRRGPIRMGERGNTLSEAARWQQTARPQPGSVRLNGTIQTPPITNQYDGSRSGFH